MRGEVVVSDNLYGGTLPGRSMFTASDDDGPIVSVIFSCPPGKQANVVVDQADGPAFVVTERVWNAVADIWHKVSLDRRPPGPGAA